MNRIDRQPGALPIVVLAAVALCTITAPLKAQYTVGLAAGGQYFALEGRRSDSHAGASFDPGPGPFWTLSLSYRESRYEHTNLGLELIYTRKEFTAHYSNGSPAGSYGTTGFVELDLLHAALVPQVFLSASRRTSIRFGIMNGIVLRSRIRGEQYHYVAWTHWERWLDDEPAEDFGGDLRLLFGFSQVFPVGKSWAIIADPYYSPALGSLFKEEPRSRGWEAGLRVGFALRRAGLGLTGLLDKVPAPKEPGY